MEVIGSNIFSVLRSRLREAQLTVSLAKSECGQACVTYLGHVVGQGQIKPVGVKVEAVINFPVPNSKSQLMRFLRMVGYYRKFCKNFVIFAEPLIRLLQKSQTFFWTKDQHVAFTQIKTLLVTAPVLAMPHFQKPFIIYVDASDMGVGAILMQEDDHKFEHPISYFSQKFSNSQKNYLTSEKETLALILALQHFEFYITAAVFPVVVYTDHNPLVFLNHVKSKNRWSLLLQKHSLERRNVLANALSRGL